MKKNLLLSIAASLLALTVTPTILMADVFPGIPPRWVSVAAPTAAPTILMAEGNPGTPPGGWVSAAI